MNRKSPLFFIDWYLLIPIFILIIISLTALFSVNIVFFRSQLLFIIFSIFIFVIFARLNYRILHFYALPIYIASIIVLLFVLLVGFESRGATRWFDIFGFRIQFSEILKPFLLISLASFLSIKNSIHIKVFIAIGLLSLPIIFFIFRQPDLGSALIYAGTIGMTLLLYGFPLWWFIGLIVGIISCFPLILPFLHSYQRQRLFTFLHLTDDPLGTSYNAIQSVIAVGSGMLLGKGVGQGTQSGLQFLPERHTDFIFATISEQLGFIGSSIVIFSFCFLLVRLYILCSYTDDAFCKIFILSVFSLLLIQFFVNIGMNIGILPVVGVTLPFVSYGGSSFLSNAILLGLVTSMVHLDNRRQVLEIK